jgi:HPt (histidine-containing phosphotransfer) domain-containing protein
MSAGDGVLERVLKALRAQYVAEAPERMRELWIELDRARQGNRQALGQLRHLLHRLAGSGGSYGLDKVTERSRAGELLAKDLLAGEADLSQEALDQLRSHIEALAAAFEEAQSTE